MATAPTPIRFADKKLLVVVVNMIIHKLISVMKRLKSYLFKIRCCQGTFFDGTVATSDDRCYWLYGTYGEEVRIKGTTHSNKLSQFLSISVEVQL